MVVPLTDALAAGAAEGVLTELDRERKVEELDDGTLRCVDDGSSCTLVDEE